MQSVRGQAIVRLSFATARGTAPFCNSADFFYLLIDLEANASIDLVDESEVHLLRDVVF